MRNKNRIASGGRHLGLVIATLLPISVFGQSAALEHTFTLDDPEFRPAATLADVSWLVGNWEGEAFGDVFEEVWNPPSSGSMVGMFKMRDGDDINFYELLLLKEEEGSLSLLVKHFTEDFVAWEEKEDLVRFRLISIEESAIHFSGLSFYRINADEIHAYLILHSGEKRWEEKLIYRRR